MSIYFVYGADVVLFTTRSQRVHNPTAYRTPCSYVQCYAQPMNMLWTIIPMFWARRKSLIHNHIHHHPQPHHTQLLTFPHHMKKMSIFIYIILFFGQCGFVYDAVSWPRINHNTFIHRAVSMLSPNSYAIPYRACPRIGTTNFFSWP